ncbi:uncharacterized protein LOC114305308, partial [Camellia sinensis]|uniref:uncharacterized protein LOC114305308 n=1 Tax=Camellia sinensis TaxID=4442 RepID=UPI001036E6C2
MRVCELRGMIKKAEHIREVLSVHPAVKKEKTEIKDILTFSSKDMERIQTPHNDALVVTLRVKDFDIKRILINQGSSVEIMYYDAFKQMKSKDKDLAPATSPLVGFNSQPEWLIEKIILPVKARSVTKQVEFWVLKVPSIYNLISGSYTSSSVDLSPGHALSYFSWANRRGLGGPSDGKVMLHRCK